MDGDPAVENELDSFSRTLPLPYRVALIIVLGVWAWGANLHYLSIVKINVPSLIQYPQRASPRTDPPHHLSAYRLATYLTIPLVLSILLFWTLSHRDPALVIYYDFLPISYICLLFFAFFLPLRHASYSGRFHFLSALKRVSIGGIALPNEGKFGDILLADVLTSYAKILADLDHLLRYAAKSLSKRILNKHHHYNALSTLARKRLHQFSLLLLLGHNQRLGPHPSHPLIKKNTSSYPLRPRLYLPAQELYYIAILLDFLLRFTWSLKLSPHLDHFADFESGIFLLEVLEVARRWMWIFLRVETEWGREKEKGNANGLLGGPGVDDVLLGDYRDDDDYSD
ncbi:hypothetical protein EYC80_005888 [Monilinia laxa]|uniref:EXS domain-containing protein n=1 Tax=Monilinia laxa TaxID=61186 RepID=A0A5N6KFE8_MONLA|nr:hypothetical protein EYC80_005888 [Monilinia laxa]